MQCLGNLMGTRQQIVLLTGLGAITGSVGSQVQVDVINRITLVICSPLLYSYNVVWIRTLVSNWPVTWVLAAGIAGLNTVGELNRFSTGIHKLVSHSDERLLIAWPVPSCTVRIASLLFFCCSCYVMLCYVMTWCIIYVLKLSFPFSKRGFCRCIRVLIKLFLNINNETNYSITKDYVCHKKKKLQNTILGMRSEIQISLA
jgi:hypothetical protein